jgi:hypothetical protein
MRNGGGARRAGIYGRHPHHRAFTLQRTNLPADFFFVERIARSTSTF